MQSKKYIFYAFCFVLSILAVVSCLSGKPAVLTADSAFAFTPGVPDAVNDYPVEPMSGKSAIDYIRDEKILSGWNMGNTLEAYKYSIAQDGETFVNFESGENVLWGNPRVTQTLINGVKNAGFDLIRIPITWMGYIGPGPDFHIDESYLKRVAEVVGYCKNAGLKTVINIHHDGVTDSRRGDIGWLSVRQASRGQADYDRITIQYIRVWKQIASYFKDYGDWLIFESFNELHDGNWQTCNDIGQLITINRWNQVFVDTVRATGGNNAERYLMISAYCNDHKQMLAPIFMLPNDPSPDKIILSYHYYDPYELGIAGTRSSWGSPEDRQRVENDFAPFKERFIDKNIPVMMGECGAVLQIYPDNPAREAQARQSRRDYLQFVFATAKKYNIVPVYWDNGEITGDGELFGLINRRNGQPFSAEADTLLKLMVNAVR